MSMAPNKAEQLHIRTSPFQKAKLAEAARARNLNVSQFVLRASLEAADDVLADQTRIVLAAEDFAEFCRLLDEPPTVLPKLREQLAKGSVLE
jgi:uncharacterized protein (DUF1778 family)